MSLLKVVPAGIRVQDQLTATSGAGTAVSVTLAAVNGCTHHLRSVTWSYSAAPTGGKLTVESPPGSTRFEHDIIAGGPGQVQFEPMKGSPSGAIVITLASGAGAVVGKLNVARQSLRNV